jgi:hypothetical protein
MTTSFRIILKKVHGGEAQLEIRKDMTIEQLRKLVADRCGDKYFAEYWLSFDGKPLETKMDGKVMTVGDYKIDDNAKVSVLSKLKGGR